MGICDWQLIKITQKEVVDFMTCDFAQEITIFGNQS